MIDVSNYSCDKCSREFSRYCKHCFHTADKTPTKFKRKKKTGCEMPEYRCPTMSPVAKPKQKENKTMYGLKLYIPFDELDAYIHEHIDEKYKDHTFIPVKVEVNELGLDIEISLVSANPVEFDQFRYKLDLNELPKENN